MNNKRKMKKKILNFGKINIYTKTNTIIYILMRNMFVTVELPHGTQGRKERRKE
jgi:ribosomal protein S11